MGYRPEAVEIPIHAPAGNLGGIDQAIAKLNHLGATLDGLNAKLSGQGNRTTAGRASEAKRA